MEYILLCLWNVQKQLIEYGVEHNGEWKPYVEYTCIAFLTYFKITWIPQSEKPYGGYICLAFSPYFKVLCCK